MLGRLAEEKGIVTVVRTLFFSAALAKMRCEAAEVLILFVDFISCPPRLVACRGPKGRFELWLLSF